MREKIMPVNLELKVVTFFVSVMILTLLGPFGTYHDLNMYQRFVFWSVAISFVGAIMHITISVACTTTHLRSLPRIPRVVIGSILGGLPGAALVLFVDAVFRPPANGMDALPRIWLQVTTVGLLISAHEFIGWRRLLPEVAPEAVEVLPPSPKIYDRLESDADIISMSMQDHYVEIMTEDGPELILMRFSDALNEVEGLEGSRVHRSHWVAAQHLSKLQRKGNKHVAVLSDERELPVSATYLKSVEQMSKTTKG